MNSNRVSGFLAGRDTSTRLRFATTEKTYFERRISETSGMVSNFQAWASWIIIMKWILRRCWKDPDAVNVSQQASKLVPQRRLLFYQSSDLVRDIHFIAMFLIHRSDLSTALRLVDSSNQKMFVLEQISCFGMLEFSQSGNAVKAISARRLNSYCTYLVSLISRYSAASRTSFSTGCCFQNDRNMYSENEEEP